VAVAIESQMAGTPPITTDFGAFPETVDHGRTGFRCHTLDQFVWAAKHVQDIDPWHIHQHAVANYSMDRVKWKYQEYFEMLSDLWIEGWNTIHSDRQDLDWLRIY
jgi:glycosyltransferase involved in cell wall biosynthesis